MTENHPEPEPIAEGSAMQPAEQTGIEADGTEFIPPPSGEQGDGKLEPGNDAGNPYAGLTPAEIEAAQNPEDLGDDAAVDEQGD